MCGIAAIFAYDANVSEVDEGELTAIRDHMSPRGPDGAGSWLDGQRRVGLGHRRLSIIDLSPAGAQPMLMPERKLAIVFNGEIYNYRELRAALEAKGRTFKSTSDTEVLLHLYVEKGEAMVNDLRGMFAFVIWDGEKNGLFLARDPFGIKPLYVADDGKVVRIASQVKALLAGKGIQTRPSSAGCVGFFLWGHIPEPFTLYREIRSLAAGSTLWIGSSGSRREWQYFSVTQIFAEAEKASRLSESRKESFLAETLRDSVAHHLIADVPVGVFLSSGLDSTTLSALAAEQGGTLRTVTLGFEEFRGFANDEVPLAEIAARQYGAKHETIWVTRQDFEREAEKLFAAMDQPSIDGVNTYFVSLAAKRAGLKVALSGLGGDEIFGGYPSFHDIPRSVNSLGWLGTGSSIGKAFRIASAPVAKKVTSPKYAGLLEYGGTFGGAYLLRRGMFMPWELTRFLDANIVREGLEELQTLAHLDETTSGIQSQRAKVSALEMTWYMRNQLLRDSDWAGMAHSLEIRVPLIDSALLRALSPSLVTPNAPTKRDMAHTPVKRLPNEILNRPKTGFHVPVREWLLKSNGNVAERGLRGWARHVYSRFMHN